MGANFLLKECKGTVELPAKKFAGMIKLGYGHVGIFDQHRSRGIWEVAGIVKFEGSAFLGHGSKLSIGNFGVLALGNNFTITAESSIICLKQVSFGNDCLLSWEVLIMDTDFHKIYSQEGNLLNTDKDIIIQDHVWIGTRCTILKGAEIASNCIVAATSLVTGKLNEQGCLYGGHPAKIIKENIVW